MANTNQETQTFPDGYTSEDFDEPRDDEPSRALSAPTERDIAEGDKADKSGPKPKKVPKGDTTTRKHAKAPPPKGKVTDCRMRNY
jgi:hypothetical protein